MRSAGRSAGDIESMHCVVAGEHIERSVADWPEDWIAAPCSAGSSEGGRLPGDGGASKAKSDCRSAVVWSRSTRVRNPRARPPLPRARSIQSGRRCTYAPRPGRRARASTSIRHPAMTTRTSRALASRPRQPTHVRTGPGPSASWTARSGAAPALGTRRVGPGFGRLWCRCAAMESMRLAWVLSGGRCGCAAAFVMVCSVTARLAPWPVRSRAALRTPRPFPRAARARGCRPGCRPARSGPGGAACAA